MFRIVLILKTKWVYYFCENMSMENFDFYNPVRVLFGKGMIAQMEQYIPKNARVLMVYGGGSIKKNGVYDQVVEALGDHKTVEYGGIQPNPSYEYALPALDIIRNDELDFILAVGGGSVVDACKFIAAASYFKGEDPWDILAKGAPVEEALPIGVVLTIPATGTEMNGNSVITREATKDKLAFSSQKVYPVFSVLDPTVTYSLPQRQLANGVVDAFVHVIEQYLTYPTEALVQDRYAESLLRILIEEGGKVMAMDQPDYDNRANIMWAATNALNHFLSAGVMVDWTTHMLGHELTALHGLDHAVTLAIVLPGVMEEMRELRKDRLLQYAERIWDLTGFDHSAIIDECIAKTEQFFKCMGVNTRLSDYSIGQSTVDLIVERVENRGYEFLGRSGDIPVKLTRSILEKRL